MTCWMFLGYVKHASYVTFHLKCAVQACYHDAVTRLTTARDYLACCASYEHLVLNRLASPTKDRRSTELALPNGPSDTDMRGTVQQVHCYATDNRLQPPPKFLTALATG